MRLQLIRSTGVGTQRHNRARKRRRGCKQAGWNFWDDDRHPKRLRWARNWASIFKNINGTRQHIESWEEVRKHQREKSRHHRKTMVIALNSKWWQGTSYELSEEGGLSTICQKWNLIGDHESWIGVAGHMNREKVKLGTSDSTLKLTAEKGWKLPENSDCFTYWWHKTKFTKACCPDKFWSRKYQQLQSGTEEILHHKRY